MLELLLSLDNETSIIFEWLGPQEIVQLACVNRTIRQGCEHWCQTDGVPHQVAMKRAEISGICDALEDRLSKIRGRVCAFGFYEQPRNRDLNFDVTLVFESYQGFLEALLQTPLNDEVVNLRSWSKRYWEVSQPRPRAIRGERFDYGSSGYWCDAFGCGAPNDYFRLMEQHPVFFLSLTLAGSDAHHIRWGYASDRENDPVRTEASNKSCIQSTDTPTEWDKTRQYWRDCGARVRPST